LFLKHLSILGFKSFADRTEVEFADPRVAGGKDISIKASIDYACFYTNYVPALLGPNPRVAGNKLNSILASIEYAC